MANILVTIRHGHFFNNEANVSYSDGLNLVPSMSENVPTFQQSIGCREQINSTSHLLINYATTNCLRKHITIILLIQTC